MSVVRRGVIAATAGALGAAVLTAAVTPLTLAGGARVQSAALAASADLASVRALTPETRVPPLVAQAAAGYEDRGLFRRARWLPPLSLQGTARAVLRNLRGIPEGGSTIPQQLAKLYLRDGRRGNLFDKASELLFATWLVRQAAPDELAALYLNLSASTAVGGARLPTEGLARLSLALFGLPLQRLSREDQLVLAASPRGVQWLREHPRLSATRIASTRAWLVEQGLWDPDVPSYLDGDADPEAAFQFVEGWTEHVASGASADLDLVGAIDRFREGLNAELAREFPGASLRAAFAVQGADGRVLARSGAESALMAVNYGSIAKLEALDLAVEAFGPQAVRDLALPPSPCVRWIWTTRELHHGRAASFCPDDVAPASHAMPFDEAVARSINSLTARHALLLPALLWQRRPDLLHALAQAVPPAEGVTLDSPADRALAAAQLAQLGEALPPESVTADLSYTTASVALFRTLRARREAAGLPAQRLPDDPTSLLGNSSRATAEQIGGYLHRKLFLPDGTCTLSDTGALLALRRQEGTLRWLAQRWPKLVFAGKTGSSPHDDSIVAAVALCLEARPVVIVAAARPLAGTLPHGLRGSSLLRGIDAYLHALAKLERKPSSALLPVWAEPRPEEPLLEEANQ